MGEGDFGYMEHSKKLGTFYGVGVGPGDPELLTVKAVRILREADVIAVPDKGSGEKTALNIIGPLAATGAVHAKTTAVRLIPAPGKVVGNMVEFGGLLGSAPVMPVHPEKSDAFVARGGRIPSPMQSLKN